MLTPHRFTNLNYCLVNVASLVIECLITRGSSSLNELHKFCKVSSSEINEQDIALAVSFLYLLNKANYNIETDIVTIL